MTQPIPSPPKAFRSKPNLYDGVVYLLSYVISLGYAVLCVGMRVITRINRPNDYR